MINRKGNVRANVPLAVFAQIEKDTNGRRGAAATVKRRDILVFLTGFRRKLQIIRAGAEFPPNFAAAAAVSGLIKIVHRGHSSPIDDLKRMEEMSILSFCSKLGRWSYIRYLITPGNKRQKIARIWISKKSHRIFGARKLLHRILPANAQNRQIAGYLR